MRIILINVLSFLTLTIMAQLEPVNNSIYRWADLPVKYGEDRESRKILEGVSSHFEYLEIHATTQYPGAKPSAAHANDNIEECIIVTEGLMKVTIEDNSTILGAGGIFLLMPQHMHWVENVGKGNLTYYVMLYKSKNKMDLQRGLASGGSLMLNADSLSLTTSDRGSRRDYFDRPTAMCERFEMHVTTLNKKGPSHDSYTHTESDIILVLSGETEMTINDIEYKAREGDLYFMNSPGHHEISNVTDKPCSYFVFRWY